MRITALHPVRLYHEYKWWRGRKRFETVRRKIRKEFDPEFYLKTYPKVKRFRIDPIKHFVMYGWRQDYDPNPLFSCRRYLDAYRDVREGGLNPFLHYVEHGRAEGRVGFASARGGMTVPLPSPRFPYVPDDEAFEGLAPRVLEGHRPDAVDVVIPVYKGFGYTRACLYSVLSALCESDFEVVVVNDASPEDDIVRFLRELEGMGLVRLIENEENLGFVESVNAGMALHAERDVILLNSDTTVYPGWIDRIVAAGRRDGRVATITPFSNNATICSYPVTAKDNPHDLEVPSADLDRLAARANRDAPLVEVPTGVGFCLWIRRKALDELGLFDAQTFGLGYGEENDFCMRAMRAGWRNVLLTDTYVEHYGSVSFGDSQSPRSLKAQKLLAERHPDYAARVMRHIGNDPALPARIRLDAARLARHMELVPTGDGVPSYGAGIVFVTHRWGGGIDSYLASLREALTKAGRKDLVDTSLVVRFNRDGAITFEAFGTGWLPFTPNLWALNIERHPELVAEVLALLSPRLVHVNSFAGLKLPQIRHAMAAIRAANAPVWHVWHDHQPLTPRLTFLDRENRLVDPLDLGEEAIAAMSSIEPLEWAAPAEWREAFAAYFEGVERVVVPSASAGSHAALLARADAIHEEPHPEPHLMEVVPFARRPARGRARKDLHVAVVGAIGAHKGAHVLHGMIEDAKTRDLSIAVDVVGYTSVPEIRTEGDVTVHGKYDGEGEAMALLRKVRPDLVLIPSIWPETYVFTLSLAFAMHLPVVVFDLGAQAERARAYGRGVVLPAHLSNDPAAVNDALLEIDLDELWSAPVAPAFTDRTSLADLDLVAPAAPAGSRARAVPEGLVA